MNSRTRNTTFQMFKYDISNIEYSVSFLHKRAGRWSWSAPPSSHPSCRSLATKEAHHFIVPHQRTLFNELHRHHVALGHVALETLSNIAPRISVRLTSWSSRGFRTNRRRPPVLPCRAHHSPTSPWPAAQQA